MPYIERLRDETKIPIVYVSHSVAEVARLATDIVVLDEGKVAASGPTSEILQRLDLLPEEERGEGGAVLEMQVAGRNEAFGMSTLTSLAGEIQVAGLDAETGSTVRVRIRARDVIVATERPRGISALNILPGRIAEHQFRRRPFRRRAHRLQRRGRHRAHHPAIRRNARSRARPRRVCRDQISHLRPRQHDARHCRPGIAFGRDDRGGECRVE